MKRTKLSERNDHRKDASPTRADSSTWKLSPPSNDDDDGDDDDDWDDEDDDESDWIDEEE